VLSTPNELGQVLFQCGSQYAPADRTLRMYSRVGRRITGNRIDFIILEFPESLRGLLCFEKLSKCVFNNILKE
jgi:hypothetical protein